MAQNRIYSDKGQWIDLSELPASETKLRQVTDNLYCGIIIVGRDKKIRFANSTAVRLMGLPVEGVVGSKFYYPLRVGEVTEKEILLPSGLIASIETRAAEIEWDGERSLLVSLQDVTELKQTEKLLRENETLFRTILESAAIGISVNTFEGRPILCNSVLQKMLGYSENELRAMVYTEFTAAEDRESEGHLHQELFSGKRDNYQVDKRYIRKDGQIIWGRLTVSLLRQLDQNPSHYVAMVEEITDHKRAEMELQQSEERWRSLAENAPDVILTVDPSGNIRYANRGFEGTQANQLIGRKVYNCVQIEHQDQLQKIFEQVVQFSKSARYEFSSLGVSGTKRWHTASVTPIVVQEKIIGVTVVINDITERKRMENELRDYNHRLETFREIDQAILTAQSSVSIVKGALEHILELVPFQWAGVAIVGDESNELSTLVIRDGDTSSLVSDAAAILATLDLSQLSEGKFYEVRDLSQVTRFNALEIMLQKSGLRSYILLPLFMYGELLGILGLASGFPNVFEPSHLTIATEVAAVLAVGIQQARLLSQRQSRVTELEILAHVSSTLRKVETYPEMLRVVVEQIGEALSAKTCGLFILENGRFVLAAGQSPCDPLTDCDVSEDQNCLWQVVRAGQPYCLEVASNPDSQTITNPCWKFTPGLTLVAWVPLHDSKTTIGILVLAFHHRDALSKGKNHLLDAIADIASNSLQRAKALHTLEQQVSDRTRRLRILYQASAATSETDDLHTMLHGSLEAVLAAMPGSTGCVQLLVEGQRSQVLVVGCGLPDEVASAINLGFQDGTPWEQVLRAGLSLRLTRGIAERRLPESIRRKGYQAYLGVPIQAGDQRVGVLSVFLQSEPQLAIGDLEVLSAVAGQLGRAVERFELRKKAEQAIVIEERQRLSRDLHDSITQLLCSQSFLAEASRKFVEGGNEAQASSYLQQLVENAHQALKEMRLMIFDLRPSVLEKEGLVGALNYRLAAVERRAGLQASLVNVLSTPLSIQEEESLYRIAQELLTNVLKHAEATSVEIYLRDVPGTGWVEMEVVDNGKGFDPAVASSGIGLNGIRERVERHGGTVTITSRPGGEGCRTTICLPSASKVEK
jgi:PAS domain S-box-containing protein